MSSQYSINYTGLRPSALLQIHREAILSIMRQYPTLSGLRVIGSVARGEDTTASDIDFLVDAMQGTTLFDMGGFLEDMRNLLGVSVDIITTRDRMNEPMRAEILREAVAI